MRQEYQLGFSQNHADVMFDEAGRRQKANKVLSILEDQLGSLKPLKLLDIGCSTGFMTSLYAEKFGDVTGVDIDEPAVKFATEKHGKSNLRFSVGDGMNTGQPSDAFDVVTCTHIYEHVPDYNKLMDEIYRVLKPGGVCFFSAGNRFILVEPHYNLPLLAAIPKPLGHLYVRLAGKADHYYENHLSYWGLKKLVKRFEVTDYTKKVLEQPDRFFANEMVKPGSFKQKAVLGVLSVAYWICPTYLWILKKPVSAGAAQPAR